MRTEDDDDSETIATKKMMMQWKRADDGSYLRLNGLDAEYMPVYRALIAGDPSCLLHTDIDNHPLFLLCSRLRVDSRGAGCGVCSAGGMSEAAVCARLGLQFIRRVTSSGAA
jgi:hypothetical protein